MNTIENQINLLKGEIKITFPLDTPPSQNEITECDCWECKEIRAKFQKIAWWLAEPELLKSEDVELTLFSPKAFHYFFPAYMLISLESFVPENPILYKAVSALSPTKTPPDDAHYLKRVSQFTATQVKVIIQFLELILQDERMYDLYADVERGLKKFWKKNSLNYF